MSFPHLVQARFECCRASGPLGQVAQIDSEPDSLVVLLEIDEPVETAPGLVALPTERIETFAAGCFGSRPRLRGVTSFFLFPGLTKFFCAMEELGDGSASARHCATLAPKGGEDLGVRRFLGMADGSK